MLFGVAALGGLDLAPGAVAERAVAEHADAAALMDVAEAVRISPWGA